MTQHGNISKHASVCTYVDSLHSFFEMSHFKRSMPWSIIINLFPIYFLLYQVVESNLLKETKVDSFFNLGVLTVPQVRTGTRELVLFSIFKQRSDMNLDFNHLFFLLFRMI